MTKRQQPIVWARRVTPHKIRQLYENDAAGIVDEELINEVGYALYARCEAVRMVTERRCLMCEAECDVTKDEVRLLRCPECGWSIPWEQYKRSYKGKRVFGGRAYEWFLAYLDEFPRAKDPKQKMLAIDRVIHGLHESLPEHLTTPAAVNLIEGKRDDIIKLLDTLAYGDASKAIVRERKTHWRRKMADHTDLLRRQSASGTADR